jgi:hypothetical protein
MTVDSGLVSYVFLLGLALLMILSGGVIVVVDAVRGVSSMTRLTAQTLAITGAALCFIVVIGTLH